MGLECLAQKCCLHTQHTLYVGVRIRTLHKESSTDRAKTKRTWGAESAHFSCVVVDDSFQPSLAPWCQNASRKSGVVNKTRTRTRRRAAARHGASSTRFRKHSWVHDGSSPEEAQALGFPRLASSGHNQVACAFQVDLGQEKETYTNPEDSVAGRKNEEVASESLSGISPNAARSSVVSDKATYAAESGNERLEIAGVPGEPYRERNHVSDAWEALVRWSRTWRLRGNENVLEKTKKVAILGGGSFGTAIAVMLARNKADMDVVLLIRDPAIRDSINNEHINRKYFPKHTLPGNVRATTDPREALSQAQYAFHAVPVQSSAYFLRSIAPFVPPSLPILSVSKGLEVATLEMMSQVIPRALGNPRQPLVVLSGPSFSIELMDELPTALVAASKDMDLARAAQQLLASRYLRVNTSRDVIGVEMAGALKNVLAIAAGIVEGMNLGNNCMAALVAQGCSEIRWLAEKVGANPATLSGVAGTGDIMLTCFVSLSRNRSVGVRLGRGESLDEILGSMSQVAEGVATAGAVIALARKYRVQLPVLTAVARILENKLTPKKAMLELMSLPQVEER